MQVVNTTKRMIVFKNPEDGQEYFVPPTGASRPVTVPLTDSRKLPEGLRELNTKAPRLSLVPASN